MRTDIPVYHVLNARVQFQNVVRACPELDADGNGLFEPPLGFRHAGAGRDLYRMDAAGGGGGWGGEDMLGLGLWEADDPELQQALLLSLEESRAAGGAPLPPLDAAQRPASQRTMAAPEPSEWACPACTFLNRGLALACEMCGGLKGVWGGEGRGGGSFSDNGSCSPHPQLMKRHWNGGPVNGRRRWRRGRGRGACRGRGAAASARALAF